MKGSFYKWLAMILCFVSLSCKQSSDNFVQADTAHLANLEGHWTSGCRLQEFEKELFASKMYFQIQESSYMLTNTYYQDGGCKEPLFSEAKVGALNMQSQAENHLAELTLTENTFALHSQELVEQYNQLNILNVSWQIDQKKVLPLNQLPQSPFERATLVIKNNSTIKFYPYPVQTTLRKLTSEDGIIFIKLSSP